MKLIVRLFLIVIFIFSCDINIIAQDIIVFEDGIVLRAEIKAVSASGDVNYFYPNQEKSVSPEDYITFQFKDQWYRYEGDSLVEKSDPGVKIRGDFFRSPSKWEYSKFSLSTNLISPFTFINLGDPSFYLKYDHYRDRYFMNRFTNSTYSIEPEYLIHNNLSIKLPVSFGFGRTTTAVNEKVPVEYHGYGGLRGHFRSYDFAEYDFNNIQTINPSIPHYYGHVRNLLVQFGVTPKIFPFGQRKQALYIAPAINFGVMDYYALDVYAQFEECYSCWYDENPNGIHRIVDEYAIQRKSEFWFVNYEAIIGLNLNWFRALNFSIETGYSSVVQNKGEADKLFIKMEGEDYILHQQLDAYNPNERDRIGFPIIRIHAVYKFNGHYIE